MLGACLALVVRPAAGLAQQAADDGADAPPVAAAPPAGAVGGMGDINLFPKRLVIDPRQRVVSVGLYNRAAAIGEYEISLSDMMMQTNGQMIDLAAVQDPAAQARVQPASRMLRFSPRHVSLPGNEAQMVRVMAQVPPDLPPGEYRSHFTVVSVPPEAGGLSIDEAAGGAPAGGLAVRITPRFGISIPVIVRVGDTTLTAGIRDVALGTAPDGGRVLTLTLTREGTRSAFGDITVTAPGVKKPVADVKGVGVYTEIDHRVVQLPLDPRTDPAALASGTKWTITYTDDDVAPGKALAKTEFIVP